MAAVVPLLFEQTKGRTKQLLLPLYPRTKVVGGSVVCAERTPAIQGYGYLKYAPLRTGSVCVEWDCCALG